ncbi:helix-turn-helix domain-containing protein [Streptomyces sp. SID7909]|uniref:helix-turn-helix domain-containing protein n=1 Tax=Streptomyces sp. SID7909 TaxID=2706092 RepID=UPI0013BB8BED|nr:helix-turn-helix domain-containing protein [Streptomyces sp. SID7909]NEC08210.1 GAF domain-containing protein [Streptomyces sp. SID7909]
MGDVSDIDILFRVFELLATEAPPGRIDELIDQARQSGLPDGMSERLDQAERLALKVHALATRRHQREAGFVALVDTARDLTLPYDLNALLKVITRRTRMLLSLDMSYISFNDPENEYRSVQTAEGHASALTVGFEVPLTSGIGKDAIDSGVPIWTADYLTDQNIRHSDVLDEVVRAEGLRALIAVPLRHGDATLGVLYAADRNVRHFTPDDVSLISSLGDLASVAIEKTRMLEGSRHKAAEWQEVSTRTESTLSESVRFNELQMRLVDLVLGGCGLDVLVTEAADMLRGEVLVRNVDGLVLAASSDALRPDEAEVLQACLDASLLRSPVAIGGGGWVASALAGSEELATLVFQPENSLPESAVPFLRAVAQSVAVLLQMQRSDAVAESPLRDELFEDLLAVPQRPLEQLTQRARRLAVDLAAPHVVVVARPEGGTQGRAAGWASSYTRRLAGLKSVRDGCIALLLPGTDAEAAARAVSDELEPLLGQPVTVGAAGPVADPGLFLQAHAEALRCVDALTALGGTGAVASTHQLGFIGVLLSENHDVEGFIESTLGPVLDYDTLRLTDLTRTLEAYFEAGSSPMRASERLHVHTNTVARRLDRITELLGPDWQKPAQALEVQLALRLHRTRNVLRSRRGGAEAAGQADSSDS